MAQPPTYQELVAQVFEENAKSVLVYHQQYEDDDAEPYEQEDYEENELEDREEFNKFAGARNKPEHVIKPKANANPSGKVSYNIDKHIRTNALNIDGRFRGNILLNSTPSCDSVQGTITGSDAAQFLFAPSRQYKNIASIRVTSFEFFNNFYTYTGINSATGIGRGNTTFTITDEGSVSGTYPPNNPASKTITVQDGNYVIVDPTQNPSVNNNLLSIIQSYVRTAIPHYSEFTAGVNPISGFVYFQCVGSEQNTRKFTITFPTTTDCATGNGIGYNLGFFGTSYTSSFPSPVPPYYNATGNQIIADTFFDTIQDTYIYLKINDWYIIKHQNYDQTEFGAFLKVPLSSPKNSIQFMTSTTNTTAREYFFPQPTNVNNMVFSILDSFGKTLSLNGSTFSVTLEIQEVLQPDIYEKMLEL
jgi:hypothetical protein